MSIRSKIVAVVVAHAAVLPLALASCSDDPSPVYPTNDAQPPPPKPDAGGCAPSFPDARWKNLTPAEAGLAHFRELSFDRDGRIYAVGEIEGRVDFGTGPLSDQGPNVTPFYFVFDKDGKPIGGSVIEGYSLTDESQISVAAFPDGGAIVTANLSGGTPGSIFGGQMLLRIDTKATLVWQQLFQASMRGSVALAPDGNVVFAGGLGRTVDLDGCTLVAHNFVSEPTADAGADGGDASASDASALDAGKQSELPDVFLATLDPTGHCVWGKTLGSPAIEGASVVRRLGIDAEGNIVIAGEMSGAVDFGGGVMQGPPTSTWDSVDRIEGSLFLAKLSKTGNHVWSSMFGDEVRKQRRVTGLAFAPDGAIAMSSYFIGNGDFGRGPFTVDANGAATLAMFDAAGQTTFAEAYTRASTGAIMSVAADATSFHAVGFVSTSDTVQIGDFRVSRPDESAILVTSFTRQGVLTKGRLFSGCDQGSARGYAIAVAPSGELVVAGALAVTNPSGPLIGTTAFFGVTP